MKNANIRKEEEKNMKKCLARVGPVWVCLNRFQRDNVGNHAKTQDFHEFLAGVDLLTLPLPPPSQSSSSCRSTKSLAGQAAGTGPAAHHGADRLC